MARWVQEPFVFTFRQGLRQVARDGRCVGGAVTGWRGPRVPLHVLRLTPARLWAAHVAQAAVVRGCQALPGLEEAIRFGRYGKTLTLLSVVDGAQAPCGFLSGEKGHIILLDNLGLCRASGRA